MIPEEKVRRGNAARELLNNGLFQEAWATLDAALIAEWVGTSPLDALNRERYYNQLIGLRAVKARLERFMQDGTIAAQEIEGAKKRATGRRPATT